MSDTASDPTAPTVDPTPDASTTPDSVTPVVETPTVVPAETPSDSATSSDASVTSEPEADPTPAPSEPATPAEPAPAPSVSPDPVPAAPAPDPNAPLQQRSFHDTREIAAAQAAGLPTPQGAPLAPADLQKLRDLGQAIEALEEWVKLFRKVYDDIVS